MQHQVTTDDGYKLSISIFETGPEVIHKGTILICSAMGVPGSYYKQFAQYLSYQKYRVCTMDYRGTFESKKLNPNAPITTQFGGSLISWAKFDVPTVIRYLHRSYKDPISLVGHSVGGQLITCLSDQFMNKCNVSAIVCVASQTGYFMFWPLILPRLQMLFLWCILIPLTARLFGSLPQMGKVPKYVALEWAYFARRKGYIFEDQFRDALSGIEDNPMSSRQPFICTRPVQFFCIEGDDYAPEASMRFLFGKFVTNELEDESAAQFIVIKGNAAKAIGHFAFFKENEHTLKYWEAIHNTGTVQQKIGHCCQNCNWKER